MTKDSLKRKIKKKRSGWKCSLLSGPLLFKGGACPSGKMVRESRKLRQNCIVLKNRTMQDMTDNPRAFYEYLIQNKINENHQIIWMVSDKKKM